jgi:endonuclease III
VATILSARTKDQTTAEVSRRLFQTVQNLGDLRAIDEQALAALLRPVGFFRTKAKHLKQLPEALEREFAGILPQTVEELCKLPGVGRKTANLVVSVAFDRPAICVDVHVHRITNRLGLLKTRTPAETEMSLRKILPVRYWQSWNRYLVSYGQTVCTPRSPHCDRCPIVGYCGRVGVRTKHAPTASRRI